MEINQDIGALEKLNSILEKLNLKDELESFFSLGFKAGIEYARKNPKKTSITEIEQNPIPSEYGC
jgi:hypothetical protein